MFICTEIQKLFLPLQWNIKYVSAKVIKISQMANKKLENPQKMTLKGYYQNLPDATHPKTEFVNRIMVECGVSFTTARNWVVGITKPFKPEHVQKLSEMTGIPADELWSN